MSPKRRSSENEAHELPKRRRTYQACINCRSRKVKCDLGPVDNPHAPPCARCKRELKDCSFSSTRGETNGTSPNMITAASKTFLSKSEQQIRNRSTSPITADMTLSGKETGNETSFKSEGVKWKFELSSMQNALEFLAQAAGTVAKEGAKEIIEDKSATPRPLVDPLDTSHQSATDGGLKRLSRGDSAASATCTPHENVTAMLAASLNANRTTSQLIREISGVRPSPTRKIEDFDYIGPDNLLTKEEAIELIEAFFLTMHPFFPNIPLQLHDPKELAEYPILFCAILTVSARYHRFDTLGLYNGENGLRHIEVHDKLWVYCQKLISQTIWAEASTRSIGTVLAFIIFTEWNPRSIHYKWSDYANDPELNNVNVRGSKNICTRKDEEGLTGVGAIRRSDRMSWMLTGSAVRLAQDMGFIENSSKIFIVTHISETTSAMNMNQRSLLAESFSVLNLNLEKFDSDGKENNENYFGNEKFYLDEILPNDEIKKRWKGVFEDSADASDNEKYLLTDWEREFLNDEYVLYYSNKNDDTNLAQNHTPPFPLRFSFAQRAKIEIIRILSIAYETIYCEKNKRKLATTDQRHNLSVLSIFSPLMEGWLSNYREVLVPLSDVPFSLADRKNKKQVFDNIDRINGESIITDFNYCQLYIFSLALQVDGKISRLNMNEIVTSARYVELAYRSAKEILGSAKRVSRQAMLKFMPVRWVIRIIRSIAFIVKCYLTLTGSELATNPDARNILKLSAISVDETFDLMRDTAVTLKEATPDELHLCQRYAAILMYLCTEMKLRKSSHLERPSLLRSSTTPLESNHGFSLEGVDVTKKSTFYRDIGGNKTDSKFETPEKLPVDEIGDNLNNSNDLSGKAIVNSFVEQNNDITAALLNNELFQGPSLSEEVTDWFGASEDIGLEFVEPWTELIEQRYMQCGDGDNNNFENLYNLFVNTNDIDNETDSSRPVTRK
ncbi:Aro80p SKDI_04G6280 [Saccharomyces kudriavzevii IFO 1802]|uniref:Uncharacterized protein n=2 Tax=Saccharomyces kudriavzevii (strain ATCC MYA-4449 / AS 2.2408 / CBS 8840 / NBRC 1802 / NCYC 2889) TaxID=226230 RepID=A0AA35NS05_SACK1|nr:uncharacterized protein SKDI_04G6280 [Saccharomyces kudriavzevii IFO 1802]EJT42408.1 ARO80-like protein [Saccharomyces kudriavzevii IFO 1802]CAI4059236.1 hypothetical protein SKDI_04G6280 [Saccharomyces kudriavzevii IFO 1802]